QDFTINKTYSLFGDNVNLRAKPSTAAKELTRLRIGFEVKIIAKTDVIFESGVTKAPWYEVEYKNIKGFIPGNFLARKALKNDTHSMFFNKKMSKEHGAQLAIRTIIGKEYSKYQEHSMQLYVSTVSVIVEGNYDLQNVVNVIKIQHHGDSCGAENGFTYFFLKENYELVYIAHLSVSGDVGYFESETFTFTTNERTGKQAILFTKEEGEVIDDDTQWTESKTMTRYYEWNGTELVPEFSKKFYRNEKSN
ncbi:MAG: SH3 domain-containing protein, partial [Bacteroidota bacterium]